MTDGQKNALQEFKGAAYPALSEIIDLEKYGALRHTVHALSPEVLHAVVRLGDGKQAIAAREEHKANDRRRRGLAHASTEGPRSSSRSTRRTKSGLAPEAAKAMEQRLAPSRH